MNIGIDIHHPTKVTREREVYEPGQYHGKFWRETYTFSNGFQRVKVKIYWDQEPPESEEGPVYVG